LFRFVGEQSLNASLPAPKPRSPNPKPECRFAESERVAARAEATKAGQEREDLRRSLRKAQEALEGAELERSHLESEKQKLVAQ
jgi:uncharacterized protein (DUF3084 family)